MRDRYVFCQRIIAVLLLSILACGCAVRTAGLPDVPPEKTLEILSRTMNGTDRIVATAQIDLTTAAGHHPVRAALILQKPSYLRLEMLPVIGTPDFFLTATPDEMRIFIPSQGEFYLGKPSAKNLAHFLPWALNIEDIVMIFSGAYPALSGKNLSYEGYVEGNLLRVDMKASAGGSQIIWLERNGRMVKFVQNGSDGREIYSVQYEDYEPGSTLAEKITIKMADNMTSVSVKYSDLKVEKTTDLSVFELPIPSGIKIIKLD